MTPSHEQQAATSGYGNAFEAIRASVPWRPSLADDSGRRLNPKPTVDGPLVATVVGPTGQEIHTDALGRIRIRHDFQTQPGQGPDTSESSTWVRAGILRPGLQPAGLRRQQQPAAAAADDDAARHG